MKLIGIAGWSGSGKTTLIVRLLPILTARGLTVSTVKHAHHGFDVDKPGKDSYEHRLAGATEVMVGSSVRWALMHEYRGEEEASLDHLLRHMSPVDLVLAEGFKSEPHDRIEVRRGGEGEALWRRDRRVVALATDDPAREGDVPVPVPVLPLEDAEAIADFILGHLGIVPHR